MVCAHRHRMCSLSLFAAIAFAHQARERSSLEDRQSLRIVNGSVVSTPSQTYPYFALPTSTASGDAWLGCGASIISPTYALTSAHCFGGGNNACSGPRNVAVWLGDVSVNYWNNVAPKSGEGMRHFRTQAQLVCSHEFDGKCSHGNDVALLKLEHPVPSWVTPVRLDLGDGAGGLSTVGSSVRSMGFGVTESVSDPQSLGSTSSELREVNVHVLAQDSPGCARVYAKGWGCSDQASEGKATNLGQQLCAGALPDQTERDTCAGDSGSPVIDSAGVQVGIVSYGGGPGGNSGPGRSCGDRDYPGIYARVSAFASFFHTHVTDLPQV